MLISKWRQRTHRYLGQINVPIVELEIQNSGGDFFPFSLCLDSGAVISLLPRSASEVLGVALEAGRAIHLSGIGDSGTKAFVHEFRIRLADLPETHIPFAIAVHDHVPGLLGREGIFDRYEVSFSAKSRETRVWLE